GDWMACRPASRSGVLCARVGVGRSKIPARLGMMGFQFWRRSTLARPLAVLPSGLQRFTSVFGMATGGATTLMSPERRSACAARLWWRRFAPRDVGWGRFTEPPWRLAVNRRYLKF